MDIKDATGFHMWKDIPKGKNVQISQKLYKDAKGFYKHIDASMDVNTVLYEVYTIPGNLCWGLSVLKPICIMDECNMTRGHFHENLERDEYYWCQSGEGLLMLMDENGYCWCEKMKEGTLHHINGHHAHRLINTGDTDLEVVCIWNGDAGHDYERVEQNPFPYRVYKRNGKIEWEEY